MGTESDRERSARLQLVSVCRVGEGAVDRVLVFPPLNDLVSRHSGRAEERVGVDEGWCERFVASTLTGAARSGVCLPVVNRPVLRVGAPIWCSPVAGEMARSTLAGRSFFRATKSVTSGSLRPLSSFLSARVALAVSLSMAAVLLFQVSRVKPRVSVVMTPWGTSWRVPRRVSAAPEA